MERGRLIEIESILNYNVEELCIEGKYYEVYLRFMVVWIKVFKDSYWVEKTITHNYIDSKCETAIFFIPWAVMPL